MSLKGSLQTVALPEVLQFLADTAKSGELQVRGSGSGGRLWFEDGAISGFDVAASQASYEAIFELLRIDEGDFDFAAGEARPDDAPEADADGRDVKSSLERGEARLAEWREILTVVPSMDHHVELAVDAPSDTLTITHDQWGLVVAIGEGRSVGEVLDMRALREFDGCRAVRDLVVAGMAVVSEPRERGHLASLVAFPRLDPEVSEHEETEEAPAPEEHVVEPGMDDLDASEIEDHGEFDANDAQGAHYAHDGHDEAAGYEPSDDYGEHSGDYGEHSDVPAETVEDHSDGEDDRYAALKSLIVEVDQELSASDPYDADAYGAAPQDEMSGSEHDMAMPAFGEPMPASVAPFSGVDESMSFDEGSAEGRAALQALLAEVSAQPLVTDDGEPVDGLADRGPWQAHELTAFDDLGGWGDGTEEAAAATDQAEAGEETETGTDTEAAEDTSLESDTPAEEPINRGLLLKFLSSVRN